MGLTAGSRLGPYEILSPLGSGGMGQVYRARDMRLARDVAIKILPETFVSDPDRVARFQREARALAALNHPNIAIIHDQLQADGVQALVMELVEGPTLADRITQGPIPLDEALPIARQIAEALEAAHEQGIVHRDLKPANVKVRPDGTVKVLDFGLAKALDPSPAVPDAAESPTITTPAMTRAGVVLGTAAYMSPEQARGKPVDKRADIWAFGCVLYEMLTSTRAFRGDEVTDTLAAVLRSEPQWSELPRDVPARVRQVLRLCLQKDPKQRMQAIGDVRLALDGALGDSDTPPAEPYRIWRRWTAWTMAAGLLLFMGWFVGWMASRSGSAPPARTVHLSVDLQSGERLASLGPLEPAPVSLSRDGQTIVYAAVRGGVQQLYRRRLDQRIATPIPGTEGAGVSFFSPDGDTIGFIAGSTMKRVALAGGEPVVVQQLGGSAASWGEDDMIVFAAGGFGTHLWSIPASGGKPRAFTSLDTNRSDLRHGEPAHLPGGRGLLYTITPSRIILRSRDGKEMVLTEGRSPRFVSSGHIVFLRDESLWAMPFDLDSMAAKSDPVKIADGVVGSIAISDDGTLANVGGRPGGAQLVWLDARGHEQVIAGAQTARYQEAVLSPDAERIALTISTSDLSTNIFVYHLVRQTLTQVTADGVNNRPLWTPDGKQLMFSSSRGEVGRNLFRRAAEGTGPIERLTTSPSQHAPWGWSHDGKTLVIHQLNSDTGWDILGLSIGGSDQPFALVQTESFDLSAAISPNGRWIAYQSGVQIHVSPFPNVAEFRRQVSTAGGHSPR
ncbi:MAG: serine/threonine-protein kinase, partial [Acidobacteria bacterium]|nr:serine/threonine-protein kinase [Acidobacteriota bacterium]